MQRALYAIWRERFHKERSISIGSGDAADWQLVDDQIGLNLLEFDRIQSTNTIPPSSWS